MTKFYFFLTALLVSLAANAQVYLVDQDNNWDFENPTELQEVGTGVYSLENIDLSEFKLSTNKGLSWDNFNSGTIWAYFSESDVQDGTPVAYQTPYNDNIKLPIIGTYNLTVNTIDRTITAKLIAEATVSYAIYGALGGNTDWTINEMTENGDAWTLTASVNKGDTFLVAKVANHNNIAGYYKVSVAPLVETLPYSNILSDSYNTNIIFDFNAEVTFTFDPETMLLSITNANNEPEPIYLSLYLRGLNGNWDATEANKMTTADGNTYTITVPEILPYDASANPTNAFKIADYLWNKANSFSTRVTDMTTGQEYPCHLADGGGSDMAVAEKISNATVTFDRKARTLSITSTTPTGIADIDADGNAPVRYYNLQGIEIPEPEAGTVTIRVEGRTATKQLRR